MITSRSGTGTDHSHGAQKKGRNTKQWRQESDSSRACPSLCRGLTWERGHRKAVKWPRTLFLSSHLLACELPLPLLFSSGNAAPHPKDDFPPSQYFKLLLAGFLHLPRRHSQALQWPWGPFPISPLSRLHPSDPLVKFQQKHLDCKWHALSPLGPGLGVQVLEPRESGFQWGAHHLYVLWTHSFP